MIGYAADDVAEARGRTPNITVTDTNWTLKAEGNLLGVSGTAGIVEGETVLLEQTSKPSCYLRVLRFVAGVSVFVQPIQSEADDAGAIGTVYTNTATLKAGAGTAVWETQCTCAVDLSEAADSSQRFLVLAAADLSANGTRTAVARLQIGAKPDDPMSGTPSGEAVCTIADASDEWFGVNFVREVTQLGGDRLDYLLQVRNNDASNMAILHHGRVLALRTDGWAGYRRGTNNADNASPTTAASTTDVVGETVTPDAGGTWLVFGAALLSHSSGTAADRIVEVKLKNGVTTIHTARPKLRNTTDRLSIGFATFVTGVNGQALELTINNRGATGNAEIRNSILVAVPVAVLPPWLAQVLTNSQAQSTPAASAEFAATISSAAQTLTEGTHIEFITTGGGINSGTLASNWYELRPVWDGDTPADQVAGAEPLAYEDSATPRGHVGFSEVSSLGWPNGLNFFMRRGYRRAGSSNNVVQERNAPAGTSADVFTAATRFVWIRETDIDEPGPDEPVTLAVDLEAGLVFKQFDPTGTTGLYQKSTPDRLSWGRVILNGAELPQATVQASAPKLTTPGTWGWDPDERIGYVYMPASPAGRTPNDERETVVVVPVEWLSRSEAHLVGSDGDTRPYRARLTNEPRIRTELQIRGQGTEAGTSIGELEIENASRAYDKRSVREVWDGLFCTIRRGHLRLSRRLSDFQTIARATIGMPEPDSAKINVGLFDRSLQLNRPVSESRITAFAGLAAQEAPRDFVVAPVVIGSPRRVAAVRVSSDPAGSATEHWFKVCQHSVVGFGNVYATPDAQSPIATGYSPTAADLLAGQFKVRNAAGGGNAAFRSDTLYVDIVGGVGGGLATAGALMEFVAQQYPLRIDEYSGSPVTTIASATHTSAYAGANCQVASTAGFAVGDVVLVRSHAAPTTTYYHAIVSAILAGPARLTLVPTYETGDAVIGSNFTAGASSSVMKTVTAGGLAITDLVRHSFRWLDRKLRKQISGGVFIPTAPRIDMVVGSDATVSTVLSMIARADFAYWHMNPLGRLLVGVPEIEARDLLRNGSFQEDLQTSPVSSRSIYPWTTLGGLTKTVTTGVKYIGSQAVEISRTAEQLGGKIRQEYILPGNPGHGPVDCVATGLVALRAGEGSSVRLEAILPSDGLDGIYSELSDPIAAESGRWKRIIFPFQVPRGGSGTAKIQLYPFYPTKDPPIPSIIGGGFLGVFSPNASLVGWLDAGRANGFGVPPPPGATKLNTWENLGTSATDATSSGGQRPRWWKNPECFLKPGLRFDDINDNMAWLTVSAAPYTVFVVYDLTDDTVVTQHRALSGGAANWMMGPHPGVGSSYLFHAYTGGSGGATSGYVGAGAALAAKQFACCGLVASSSSLAEHFVNGVSVGTNTATSQNAPGQLFLGKGGSVAESLNGVICEVLVWNRALTTPERQAVESYLTTKYGLRAVTLALANFQVFKLGTVLRGNDATPGKLTYDEDTFYEVELPFDANMAQPEQASFIRANDSQGRQLGTAVSQAKNAVPGARRLTVTDVFLNDPLSSAGVASHYAGYLGRQRHRIPFRRENVGSRLPAIGELAMHVAPPDVPALAPGASRVPELIDEHPVHLIVAVELHQKGAKGADILLERQTDFVSDRTTIAASDLSVGLIFMCVDSACPGSGYSEEVVAMRGFYVLAGAAPDLSTVFGNVSHRHQLDHVHGLANHSHTYGLQAENVGLDDGSQDIQSFVEFVGPNPYPLVFNVSVARGFLHSSGTHQHGTSGSGFTTGNPLDVSVSQPTATLRTYYGGNDITWKNVLFCKRIGGTGNFPTTMVAGYHKATAPPGWNRADGGGGRPLLDGFAPRGAHPSVDGTDTTIKAGSTFSPSNAAGGSALDFTSPTNVRLFQRLTIVNGGSTVHVAVVQAPGTGGLAVDRAMVQTLHEDNDTADVADGGTTYPAGSAIQIDDARPNTSVTIAAHRHQKSGGVGTDAVPNHQHTARHRHFGSTAQTTDASAGAFLVTVYNLDGSGSGARGLPVLSLDGHVHDVNAVFPFDSTASSSTGGNITSATANAPDRFALVPIMPADANQNVLHAGMVFFSDTVCPNGFSTAEDALDLLIVFAAAGLAGGAIVGGHGHGFDAAAHTVTHRHEDLLVGSGKFRQLSEPDKAPPTYAMAGDAAEAGKYAVVAGYWLDSAVGHRHYVTVANVQQVGATLSATNGQTSEIVAGLAACPPALRLLVCRKD